jgi:hypothetical protein
LENSFDLMTSGSKSNMPQDDAHNQSGSENNSTRIMNTLIRAELLGQRGADLGGSGDGSSHPNKVLRSGGSPSVLR